METKEPTMFEVTLGGDGVGGRTVSRPDVSSVVALFKSLDGRTYSELLLEAVRGEKFLTVGGGGSDGYVCSVQDGEAIHILLRPGCDPSADPSGETVEVFSGQASEWPVEQVVDRPTVVLALEHYTRVAKPHPDLTWHAF